MAAARSASARLSGHLIVKKKIGLPSISMTSFSFTVWPNPLMSHSDTASHPTKFVHKYVLAVYVQQKFQHQLISTHFSATTTG